jgi:hypothetical protein
LRFPESRRNFAILEERFNPPVVFDDSGGPGLIEFRERVGRGDYKKHRPK